MRVETHSEGGNYFQVVWFVHFKSSLLPNTFSAPSYTSRCTIPLNKSSSYIFLETIQSVVIPNILRDIKVRMNRTLLDCLRLYLTDVHLLTKNITRFDFVSTIPALFRDSFREPGSHNNSDWFIWQIQMGWYQNFCSVFWWINASIWALAALLCLHYLHFTTDVSKRRAEREFISRWWVLQPIIS